MSATLRVGMRVGAGDGAAEAAPYFFVLSSDRTYFASAWISAGVNLPLKGFMPVAGTPFVITLTMDFRSRPRFHSPSAKLRPSPFSGARPSGPWHFSHLA